MEPQYAFSIPSIEDDIQLDCRIYHPNDLATRIIRAEGAVTGSKGAIIAHPYAPLGGCYDDHVVLALAETLIAQGYVVGTFNFRGAGDSAGRTTWTGKAELQDYVSFTGFMMHYLHGLSLGTAGPTSPRPAGQTLLLLAGYSYGSLILARLPPTADIIKRFETADLGTAAAEVILRARTLAKQTRQGVEELQSPISPRGRTLKPEQSPTSPSKRVSPMTVGGEETDPSDRRRSRDSRRSVDVIRKSVEVPHRIKAHIKHRHVSREQPVADENETPKTPKTPFGEHTAPLVSTSYLFISPVLLPFSNTLLPPGAPTSGFSLGKADANSPKQYLHHPTLTVFGSTDAFTSSKRLKHWAEEQTQESKVDGFRWSEVEGAGHFWNEAGVLQAMLSRVAEWTAAMHGRSDDTHAAG